MTSDDVGLPAGAIACEAAPRPPHAILAGCATGPTHLASSACRYIHIQHAHKKASHNTARTNT